MPAVEPLVGESAFVDHGAPIGGCGEDEFGVGKCFWEGLGVGILVREEGWGEFRGGGAAAVEDDEGLFVFLGWCYYDGFWICAVCAMGCGCSRARHLTCRRCGGAAE